MDWRSRSAVPSRDAPPRLLFHIGLEKTGSTSIQHFCADNSAALWRHGVLYPKRNAGYGLYNHANLAAAYLGEPEHDFTVTRSRRPRSAVVASVIAEIERSGAATVLLSAEHFSSRFGEAEMRQLWDDFARFDKRVVVVVRDHLARFFSSYSTYVWGGGTDSLDDYADRILSSGSDYFRVKETLERWEAVVGPDAVWVIDYDRHPDIVPAFLDLFCPAAVTRGPRRRYHDKAALTPGAVEAVRIVNSLVAARQGSAPHDLAVWLQRRFFQRSLGRTIAALDRASPRGRWTLDPRAHGTLDAIAERDRLWLHGRFGLTIQAPERQPQGHADAGAQAAAILGRALVDARTRGLWPTSVLLLRLAARIRRWTVRPPM